MQIFTKFNAHVFIQFTRPLATAKENPQLAAGCKPARQRCERGIRFFFLSARFVLIMASSVTLFQPRVYSGVDFQRPRYEPRPSSAKLSGMKFELYNPRLPTLRRMDMDSVSHKLSSEHSRTTTPCSRGSLYSIVMNVLL
jgi:hypothetical protein